MKQPNILLVVSDQERRPRVAAGGRLASVAGAAAGGGPRARQPLHAQLAVLALAGVAVHRSVHLAARRRRQRDHARARRARSCDPDNRLDPPRRRIPVELHRQVALLAGAVSRHDGVRVRRLGRKRPPLHGLGGHRCALRPVRRVERGVVVAGQRDHTGPTVVPHGRAREPPRRDVVPDRPNRGTDRSIPPTSSRDGS